MAAGILGITPWNSPHDTFGRVFAKIDPEEFEQSFLEWVQAVQEMTAGQVIAIDGKQLCGSHNRSEGKSALYMVSAWATANRLVLGQTTVEEKSNEITAIPKLIDLLDLQGCLVTIDSIGTQMEIAEQIVAKGAIICWRSRRTRGTCMKTFSICLASVSRKGLWVLATLMPEKWMTPTAAWRSANIGPSPHRTT